MTTHPLALQRLHHQQIASTTLTKPEEVVNWLGAVQAQDYLGSLWAIGLRMKQATEASVEQAIATRAIIRTWPMRGTLHFVSPADVRWMLNLLAPRVIARCAGLYKQAGLDKAAFAKSRKLLTKALQGGRQLTRNEMYEELEQGKISTTDQRGLHILGHLAMEGLLCLGTRKGKQQTFVLLDEWIPSSEIFDKDEALGNLTRRYFTGHGPATINDYAWWSGLTIADAKAGLEMVKAQLEYEVVDGNTYWTAQNKPVINPQSAATYLLPAYDEYTVAYKDRSAVLNPVHAQLARNGIFNPVMISDGKVVGTWKRTINKDDVVIEAKHFDTPAKSNVYQKAVENYARFIGMPVELVLSL
jgi:hypothetical protein